MLRNLIAVLTAMVLNGCFLTTPGRVPVDGGPDGDGDGDGDGDVDGDADLPDGCMPEICNYSDDDCDGLIDDGFNLSTDTQNCGACDLVCPADPTNATSICVAGRCDFRCVTGFRNCNRDEVDGCEADLSSPETCGDCDVACRGDDPLCEGDILSGYSCVGECTEPMIECDGRCVDSSTDILHCGRCDNACPTEPNSTPTCDSGECGFDCEDLYGDCDASDDGCETPLTTRANCGACDFRCDLAHAEETCSEGECAIDGCQDGWDDCDGLPNNGCEEELDSEAHCGGCYERCEADEECLYGICVPPCPDSCMCSDHNCRISAPCECGPGCPCTDLMCGSDCAVNCNGPDTLCIVDASRVSNFNHFSCMDGAYCIVDVTDSENFEDHVICSGGGTECHLTCDTVSNCYPTCVDGAVCMLECRSTENCEFEVCAGVLTDCGGDVFACNGSCP